MITKKFFLEIINKLKLTRDFVTDVNNKSRELQSKLYLDGFECRSLFITHEDLLVTLLESIFNTDMISYWIYELDYGTLYEDGCVQEQDGTNIDISTAEKLYDYLMEEIENGKK